MHLSAGKLHDCELLSEESYGKALLFGEYREAPHSSSRDGAFCSCLKGPSLSFINPSNMSAAFLDDIINVALKTPAPVQSVAHERHRVF
ncbi:uncharacterized [Tachysurus ichikawai]